MNTHEDALNNALDSALYILAEHSPPKVPAFTDEDPEKTVTLSSVDIAAPADAVEATSKPSPVLGKKKYAAFAPMKMANILNNTPYPTNWPTLHCLMALRVLILNRNESVGTAEEQEEAVYKRITEEWFPAMLKMIEDNANEPDCPTHFKGYIEQTLQAWDDNDTPDKALTKYLEAAVPDNIVTAARRIFNAEKEKNPSSKVQPLNLVLILKWYIIRHVNDMLNEGRYTGFDDMEITLDEKTVTFLVHSYVSGDLTDPRPRRLPDRRNGRYIGNDEKPPAKKRKATGIPKSKDEKEKVKKPAAASSLGGTGFDG